MKRFIMSILAFAVLLGPIIQAEAAQQDSLSVKVTIISALSVDIVESELDLGDVNVGSTTELQTGVTVRNTGTGIPETYSLSLANPQGWTASQTARGVEIYVLNAAFDGDGNINWDVDNHALSTTPTACTSTKYASDQTGVNVPYNTNRTLWFQFLAPEATNVTTEQEIIVTITAEAA